MSSRGAAVRIADGTTGNVPISVPSTTVVYSKAFQLKYGTAFGIWLKAAGTGSPNMKIELQQSANPPAAEIAVADANYVVGDGVPDIYSALADTNAHVKSLSPVPMTYARLKITGLGSNPADATLDFYIFEQELIAN